MIFIQLKLSLLNHEFWSLNLVSKPSMEEGGSEADQVRPPQQPQFP